jgi:excisionase family DNA binding protein
MAEEFMSENSGEEESRWLTIKEACKYLDVSEQTVYRWMREGSITFYKIGDSTRFKEEDLEKVVQKHVSFKEAKMIEDSCSHCGHSELTPGKLSSTGRVYFRPAKVKFFTLKEPMVEVEAKVCPRCGFVTLSADTEKMKALEKKPAREPVEDNGRE